MLNCMIVFEVVVSIVVNPNPVTNIRVSKRLTKIYRNSNAFQLKTAGNYTCG